MPITRMSVDTPAGSGNKAERLRGVEQVVERWKTNEGRHKWTSFRCHWKRTATRLVKMSASVLFKLLLLCLHADAN